LITGDKGLCEEANKIDPNITTVTVNEGKGSSTIGIHPTKAIKMIKSATTKALSGDFSNCKLKLPSKSRWKFFLKTVERRIKTPFIRVLRCWMLVQCIFDA
jgi:D-amino peptidase